MPDFKLPLGLVISEILNYP